MFVLMPLDEKSLWILLACVVFMFLDILTGLVKAFYEKRFSSTKMREGIFHKIALVLVLFMGWFCDTLMAHVPELGLPQMILFGVGLLIFLMEMGSILENVSAINPNLKGSKILAFFATSNDVQSS